MIATPTAAGTHFVLGVNAAVVFKPLACRGSAMPGAKFLIWIPPITTTIVFVLMLWLDVELLYLCSVKAGAVLRAVGSPPYLHTPKLHATG